MMTRHPATRLLGSRRLPHLVGQPDLVVLDADGDHTSAWSPAGRMGPEPAVSAVDRLGRCQAHGVLAVEWAARPENRLRLERSYTSKGAADRPDLARLHVLWALAACGRPRFRDTVVLPVRESARLSGDRSLAGAIQAAGAAPLLVSRSMAAAVGLGLDVDGERAHMLVEVTDTLAEIAVVADGTVLRGLVVERPAVAVPEIAAGAREVLGAIDPDQELDIRDSAIHLHGRCAERTAAPLERMLGVRVATRGGRTSPVLDGALRIGVEARPRLPRI